MQRSNIFILFLILEIELIQPASGLEKPNNSKKLITNPMSPETSTKENPMKEYRNNSSRCDGFLPIETTNEPQVRPTPMATPMKAEEAIAPAINLKPMVIILLGIINYYHPIIKLYCFIC